MTTSRHSSRAKWNTANAVLANRPFEHIFDGQRKRDVMDKQMPVSLDLIDPNPYQPRQAEDPAVVAEIAESIQRHGLMQVPTARAAEGGRYQLAFGHTRLAAVRLNGEPRMPLIIRDLSGLQMFELGGAE